MSTALHKLGWSDHFARQQTLVEGEVPARISAVHRSRIDALTEDGTVSLAPTLEAGRYAVGDWVIASNGSASEPLERLTEISRRAAGEDARQQLIAANVDTLGIVTSCNADFNIARIERYLAMTAAAGCLPLVILTKADQADAPQDFVKQAQRLSPLLQAIAINAKDQEDTSRLAPWCSDGQTLALVGSSGVGKTTIQNHLTGVSAATSGIREDDAKGRHTTTNRALRPTLSGGWLIDTPGMRELRLLDAEEGVDEVFQDITDLVSSCRFNDCAHETEPGCAVIAAIEAGTLDPERLIRWRKLDRESRINTETVSEGRARMKKLGKLYSEGLSRGKAKRGR